MIASCLVFAVVFSHVFFDPVSLDGDWEMAYQPYEYGRELRICPRFKGYLVEKAVPGYWEDMIEAFRRAGMTDKFRINPLYGVQEFPAVGCAQDMTLPNVYGCFLYRKKIGLDRDGAAVLAFEGVRNQVHVWINGRFVAFRQGFSTPFELSIPNGVLKRGENEIVLAVSNNPNLGYCDYVSGLTTRSVFSSTGGVNGHLELRFPKNDISDIYVTTARDLKSCRIHVTGDTPFSYAVADGETIVRSGSATGDFSIGTEGLSFWSPESPKLYELRIRTEEGRSSHRFGIRRFVAEGERYRLNGRPVYLRGVTEHCYFPQTVHVPRDKRYYRMVTEKRKQLGFNFVRFHTFVPPVEYLEALDELGMLAHIETPNFVARPEFASIMAFARSHPSVVIYCMGNETRIDRIAEAYLEDAAELVHSTTDSLFTPMSALRGIEYCVSRERDQTVALPFEHSAGRVARMSRYCDLWTSYQLGATSYESLNGGSTAILDAWGDAYGGKPRNSHEICIDGSYLDLSLEKMYDPRSPILKTGLFSGVREQLVRKGLVDRADVYFRNSCEWMRHIRKFTFEKLRAADRVAGFDFLGDINTHWHTFGYSVGMMDEFYRLKPGETIENVRRYNSATVILSDLGSDFNVLAGCGKSVSFRVSNYQDDMPDAKLTVSLVNGDGAIVWSEERCVGSVTNGCVSDVGAFSVPVPMGDSVQKYRLTVVIAGGTVRAENLWELYAFPDCAEPERPVGVRMEVQMTREDLLSAMGRGERVLLLGSRPFKTHPMTYRIGLAGRCAGDYATVLKSAHPVFDGLPNEGWCGWQFRRLMEGAQSVQLEAGIPFDPIVDVASSEKCVIRQSPLFEYRVGTGRLLVCSFRFDKSDPAAKWMRRRLYDYVSSERFQPAQSLSVCELAAVMDAPLVSPDANSNVARNLNDMASSVRDGVWAQP